MSYGRYSLKTPSSGSSYGSSSSYSSSIGSSYGGSKSSYGLSTSLSDTSRSYGSQGGRSSASSLYKSYDFPSRSSNTSSYSAGLGSSYDSYRSSASSDRTLGYLSAAGSVSSVKGKFDRSTPLSSSRYPSSLDRYSSDRTTTSTDYKIGGYSSDIDRGSSYVSPYSTRSQPSSSSLLQSSSYVPSSSTASSSYRPSTSAYRAPPRDFGTSYTIPTPSSSSQTTPLAKSSSYNLTPFDLRRNTKSSDINLTPYTSRVSSNLPATTPKSYDRSPSVTPLESSKESASDKVSTIKNDVKKSSVVFSDSSDSAEEPTDKRKRDPNVRYLTSRASSPMEVDREACDASKFKNRNRLMARTKTKTYPVGDKTRRRQLKNIHVQVDVDELDKFCGRFRVSREKLEKLAPEKKYGVPRYEPPAIASENSSETNNDKESKVCDTRDKSDEPVIMPKQSGFQPRNRKLFHDRKDENITVPAVVKPKEVKSDEKDSPELVPKQSSFVQKNWKQVEEEKEINKLPQKASDKQNPDLSLKESIEKVKSWKKQLKEHLPPDSPDEDNPIFGKDEWRKKTTFKKTQDVDSRESGRFQPDKSPNQERRDKKLSAGVPKFPLDSDKLDAHPTSVRSKQIIDRSPSPYDNVKSQRASSDNHRDVSPYNHRDVSPYDNLEKSQSKLSVPKLNRNEKSYASNDSLRDFGGDISASSDDDSTMTDSWPRQVKLPSRKAVSLASLASSLTSLPDLVTSSEGRRRGAFIGKLQDIDSLLGFGDSDDDEDKFSEDSTDDDKSGNSQNQKNFVKSKHNSRKDGVDVISLPKNQRSHSHQDTAKQHFDDELFIGDSKDIDDLLDPDMAPKFLGNVVSSGNPAVISKHFDVQRPLHLDIPPVTIDFGSSDSLLDTPVPDTPDIPLSPIPVFFAATAKSPSSEKHRPTSAPAQNLPATSKLSCSDLERTKSFGDFADFDGILELFEPPQKIILKTVGKLSLNLFENDVGSEDLGDHRNGSAGCSTAGSSILGPLVDLTFDEAESSAEEQVSTAKKFYPPGYTDAAIKEVISRYDTRGKLTISELLEICKRVLKKKPPWVEDEEDRRFAGYADLNELIEAAEVDTKKLEDCAAALYKHTLAKDGRSITYLQYQTSLDDDDNPVHLLNRLTEKNSNLISKVHQTVKVHALIEKLSHLSRPNLRRVLFSLKQIIKDDKDMVKEFVYGNGLTCLVKISSDPANHGYLCYILRALGQLMLYVDGMYGVISNNEVVQWLYTLIDSKSYPVVRTSLRLLAMFVEYSDCNAFLLHQAISLISHKQGLKIWSNFMDLIKQKDSSHVSEVSLEAIILINKVLRSIPDQDTFYDISDSLEDQELEKNIQIQVKHSGTKTGLLEQFEIYESMMREEDMNDCAKLDLIQNTKQNAARIQSKNPNRKSRRYSKFKEEIKKNKKTKKKKVPTATLR